jgi:hypothetical protein
MKLLAAMVGGSALVAMGALTMDGQAGATMGFENVDVTSAIQSTPATASAAPRIKAGVMPSEEALWANPMAGVPQKFRR